jgi:alkylation response protein AidB-like acyl-CoA dehydrogenase
MDYRFSDDEESFRERIREIIAEGMSPDYPGIFTDDPHAVEESFAFAASLGAEGLLTRAWPAEYGGQDASLWSQLVFNEEMWAHNEPRGGQYMGVTWIGPALMQYGTPQQRDEHLPRISAGEVQWCQGFSEPDAGSDLASLKTAATRVEGGYKISGQKIWTSYANLAHYCVLAARTDSSGPKQHGITVFLIPMGRAGVTVRPIDTMLGPNHFNEVFLDDVFASDDEVLGEVDKGWEVMNAGLAFERVGIPRYARSDRILAQLQESLTPAQLEDAAARIAVSKVHTLVARLLTYRTIAERDKPSGSTSDGPVSRIAATQLDQEVADLAMDELGLQALVTHHEAPTPAIANMEHHWRYAQSATVAAGALEIQKMLVGRAELAG